MRARRRAFVGKTLLPLPDGDLTLDAMRQWLADHQQHEPEVFEWAYLIGKISQMASPGRPDRELAEQLWSGVDLSLH